MMRLVPGSGRLARLSAASLLAFAVACSEGVDETPPRWSALAPAVAPELPDVSPLDLDGNRVDDALDHEVRLQAAGAEETAVEVIFRRPVTATELDAFAAAG